MNFTDLILTALIPAIPALAAALIGWLNQRKAKKTAVALGNVRDHVQAIDVKVNGNLSDLNLRIAQLTEVLHVSGVAVPAPVIPEKTYPPVPPAAHP